MTTWTLRPGRGSLGAGFDFARGLVVRLGRDRATGHAAELAFWLFLALLPILVVSGMVAARLALSGDAVVAPLLAAMPPAAREEIAAQLARVAALRGDAIAPAAAAGFLALASSGVQSIFDALEAQTGLTRPWWRKRLVALAACLVLALGAALVGFLGAGLDVLLRVLAGSLPAWLDGALARALRGGLQLVVAVAVVAFLYRVGLPADARRRRMPVLPGALLVVALNAALGVGYRLYVAEMGTGDAYTAGLAVVGVILTALYLFALAFLVGAELNQMIAERRRARGASESR